MKRFKLLTLALVAVLACVSFASCSDDDKDEPNGNIVGKWNCYKVVYDYDGKSYRVDIDFDFKSDNTFTVNFKDSSGTMTGKYTTTKTGTFTVKFEDREDAPEDMSGSYTISGNELVASYQQSDSRATAYLKSIK